MSATIINGDLTWKLYCVYSFTCPSFGYLITGVSGERVMEFSNSFTIVYDVIEVMLVYRGYCTLQLYNEHGRELDSKEVVENARVYMV